MDGPMTLTPKQLGNPVCLSAKTERNGVKAGRAGVDPGMVTFFLASVRLEQLIIREKKLKGKNLLREEKKKAKSEKEGEKDRSTHIRRDIARSQ